MIEDSVYNKLSEIVGDQFITRAPAILDTYAFQWGYEIESVQRGEEPSRFGIRPGAVVLPETTYEVQAIVKICNEYDIRFKALSTGMGPWAGVSHPRSVQIDLRRMNRILEIDPKNLMAWYKKGYTFRKIKRYEEAIMAFDNALAVDPDFSYAK